MKKLLLFVILFSMYSCSNTDQNNNQNKIEKTAVSEDLNYSSGGSEDKNTEVNNKKNIDGKIEISLQYKDGDFFLFGKKSINKAIKADEISVLSCDKNYSDKYDNEYYKLKKFKKGDESFKYNISAKFNNICGIPYKIRLKYGNEEKNIEFKINKSSNVNTAKYPKDNKLNEIFIITSDTKIKEIKPIPKYVPYGFKSNSESGSYYSLCQTSPDFVSYCYIIYYDKEEGKNIIIGEKSLMYGYFTGTNEIKLDVKETYKGDIIIDNNLLRKKEALKFYETGKGNKEDFSNFEFKNSLLNVLSKEIDGIKYLNDYISIFQSFYGDNYYYINYNKDLEFKKIRFKNLKEDKKFNFATPNYKLLDGYKKYLDSDFYKKLEGLLLKDDDFKKNGYSLKRTIESLIINKEDYVYLVKQRDKKEFNLNLNGKDILKLENITPSEVDFNYNFNLNIENPKFHIFTIKIKDKELNFVYNFENEEFGITDNLNIGKKSYWKSDDIITNGNKEFNLSEINLTKKAIILE